MTKLLLQCDGGSRGNPGPAAFGYVVYDITSGAGIVLEKCGNYLGHTTNNQAEYEGLLAGLTWIYNHHPDAEVEIKMDSLLIVNQVKGLYKVKNPNLFSKHQAVKRVISMLPKVAISHTYRAGNSLADSLVNQVLDAHEL